ncbi:hypothetical protein Ahy_A07g031739 isoform B [Arachis hypogaea]|uniref:Uncharacterized protein n=1 Tax=Arachis hypogaea TaxID=3818 RepID=A0A445C4Z2_ARAHY|nr:hypothetical protein Ahy_A07g031739 isoform B [Arachis hypogaea]
MNLQKLLALVSDSLGNLKKMCYILLRSSYNNSMTKIQDMLPSTCFSHMMNSFEPKRTPGSTFPCTAMFGPNLFRPSAMSTVQSKLTTSTPVNASLSSKPPEPLA